MKVNDLTGIRAVTAAALAASEARMTALRHEEARIVARIDDLDAALRRRAAEATAEDPALRAGADLRWQEWVERSRSALLSGQARLRAAIEAERATLRLTFGRDLVAGELLSDAMARQRLERSRRIERE
ncbi:MAG: hypothetical protein IT542_10760 [Rubellimicrobium sp.]|nr:hypothetical protein [Rubellimicrobium sp.]